MDPNNDQSRYQLVKTARLYYLEDLNQKEIAEKLNVSVATVSRMLSRAKRERIVEITINDAGADFRQLEIEFERRFGLKECRILPTREKLVNIYKEMAAVISELLARLLAPHACFGVSWGETLKTVGDYLSVERKLNVRVVPIIGAMGTVENGIYPNAIAKEFAAKLGGVNYLVNAPAISDSAATRASLEQERSFQPAKELWSAIDAALISVSGLGPEASVARYGLFTAGELAELNDCGAVCATNFNMLDASGREVPNELSKRILNLGLPELMRIPNLIVAAAGIAKAPAIEASLRGGIPDILVIDSETAEAVMREIQAG